MKYVPFDKIIKTNAPKIQQLIKDSPQKKKKKGQSFMKIRKKNGVFQVGYSYHYISYFVNIRFEQNLIKI